MSNLRECEPEEVVTGLQVILNLDLIRPLFPEVDEATVRLLLNVMRCRSQPTWSARGSRRRCSCSIRREARHERIQSA